MRVRDASARELLERRRQAWLDGTDDLSDIEREIAHLGYVFVDEPDVDDGRYSHWRKR